jgi:hypothetical protein
MTNRVSALVSLPGAILVVAGVLTVGSLTVGQAPSSQFAAQFPAGFKAPRTADGKPDFNGIWQALTTANWDIQDHPATAGLNAAAIGVYGAQPAGLGIVEGNEIPYQSWALARKKENFEKRLISEPANRSVGDPETKCYMPGLPRATYMPFPFQIIQGTDKILIAYEFADVGRVVYLGKMDPPPVDSWMGQSVGRFVGDTLEITATGFNDQTWFDRAGNFHSEQLRVVERFTPVSPYHLNYEATIEDPKVFTRPWKISFPLYRRMERGARLLEFKCVEFSEEFLYGKLRRQPGK